MSQKRKVEQRFPKLLTIKNGEISENFFLLLKTTSFLNLGRIAFSKKKCNDISECKSFSLSYCLAFNFFYIKKKNAGPAK